MDPELQRRLGGDEGSILDGLWLNGDGGGCS